MPLPKFLLRAWCRLVGHQWTQTKKSQNQDHVSFVPECERCGAVKPVRYQGHF